MMKEMKENPDLDKNRLKKLKKLCDSLKTKLNNYELLHQALTHSSYAHETKDFFHCHNERLEFLGDSVLNLIISRYLFVKYPELSEGHLSFIRSQVVCEPTLAKRAIELNLGDYLLLGRGEKTSGGRERFSILADAYEAVIGAIFLDAGLETAAAYVLENLKEDVVMAQSGDYYASVANKDYKSWLQEYLQKNGTVRIFYELVSEKGPDHNKLFDVAVTANDRRLGAGSGKSKKEAEQNAARQALVKLEVLKLENESVVKPGEGI